jgi:hypothetical protein
VVAMVSLATGKPPMGMFIILAVSGVVAEVVGDVFRFYYYRRGF